MAKTHATLKTKKNSDDLILIAGILLLLVGAFIFFTYDNSQKAANATPTPKASIVPSATPSAIPTVKAEAKGPASDGLVFMNITQDQAYAGLKNGSVDIYLGSLTAAQAVEAKSNPEIALYPASSQINGIIFNPAPSANGTFNPFALQQVRFAFNYLLDRKALVETAHSGFGKPIVTNVFEGHPSYYVTEGVLSEFNITYDKAKALSMIDAAMAGAGATKKDGKWTYAGKPVNVTVIFYSRYPEFVAMSEAVAQACEQAGFAVNRLTMNKGDKNPADYTDPALLKWNVDVSAWIFYGASKYSDVSFMGLSNKPGWYEFKNAKLNTLGKRLSNYSSRTEWEQINEEIARQFINDSVSLWLTENDNIFAARSAVKGVVQDNFVGLRAYQNLRGAYVAGKPVLTVATDNTYYPGDSWNNIVIESINMMDVHNSIVDPLTFSDPKLEVIQYRWGYKIDTAGPSGKLSVPADAIVWNTTQNKWVAVGSGLNATSKVTYDLSRFVGTKWHHNATISMADVLYFAASLWEMSLDAQKNETSSLNYGTYFATLKGMRISGNTVEVYEDSWGISDENFLSFSGIIRRIAPLEIEAGQDRLFYEADGKYIANGYNAPEGSNATSLVLVNSTHVKALLDSIDMLDYAKVAPYFTVSGKAYATQADIAERKASVHKWADAYGHLIIGDGAFYMKAYNPVTGAITLNAYRDSAYPFVKAQGMASDAGDVQADEYCANPSGKNLSYAYARQLALKGECAANGTALLSEHWCNNYTGTWWIKTGIEKKGCNPTCVINVETQATEINWMCTGVLG